MSTKMRGVFNSLRYISQIFEKENEKEKGKEEMQIGLPTDVKHVSHMGSDGAAGGPNTWMNAGSADTKDKSTSKDPPTQTSADVTVTGSVSEIPTRPKQSRRHNSSSGLDGSTGRDSTHKPRRNKSSNLESSSRDAINRPRRRRNSSIGSEPSSDSESMSRRERSHRRKSKDMNGSGSDTGHDPLTDYGSDTGECRRHRSKTRSKDMNTTSVSERREEEEGNETDDLSKEIGAL